MSRPRDESRRTELAKQACAVLQREGLGISAERLASELGLKRPSLLYYFPTYADILQVALVDLLSVQTAYVSERVSRESHPLRQLYARICATYDFHETRGEHVLFLTQALAATLGSKVADLLKVASAIFDDQRRDMVQRIEQGVEEGLVHPCDAEGLVEHDVAALRTEGDLHRVGEDVDAAQHLLARVGGELDVLGCHWRELRNVWGMREIVKW